MDEYTELNSQLIKSEMQGQYDRLKRLMQMSFVCVSFLVIEFIALIVCVIVSCSESDFQTTTSFEKEWREFKHFVKLYFVLN